MSNQYSNTITEIDAWNDKTHAEVFDYLHKQPDFIIKKHYEGFNEGKILLSEIKNIKGNIFYEIGCATGEYYRYIKKYMSQLKYYGFDISNVAINRAKEKYPDANFYLVSNNIDSLFNEHGRPDITWCKDVILHQKDPYNFLYSIINNTNEALFIRLRTRDHGNTEFNSDLSCQLHWGKYWVPYIVLNTEELIEKIKTQYQICKIIISRSYEPLGGINYRYLPKELYYPETGTAETAIYIQKGSNKNLEIEYVDMHDRPKYGLFEKLIYKISNRIK